MKPLALLALLGVLAFGVFALFGDDIKSAAGSVGGSGRVGHVQHAWHSDWLKDYDSWSKPNVSMGRSGSSSDEPWWKRLGKEK